MRRFSTKALLFLVSFGVALVLTPATFADDCNNPPRGFGPAWWSEYKQWCSRNGGTPYQDSRGGGCTPGPNWCNRGGNSSSGTGQPAGYCDPSVNPFCIIGNWLAKELFGSSNDTAITADGSAAAAEAERQRMLELERERQRQQQIEAERKAQFRQDMQHLQLEMKGPKLPDESLLFKSTSCPSQVNCQPDGGLEFKPINAASGQQVLSGPLDQLRISACLSKMAAAAKTPDEASYLSAQAAKAMQGAALEVDVSGCPKDATVTSAAPVIEKTTVDPSVIQRSSMKDIGGPIFDCDGDRAKLKRLVAGRPNQQAAIDRTRAMLNGTQEEYAEGVHDAVLKSTQFLTDASLIGVLRARTLLARAQMMKNTPGTDPQAAATWKLLQKAKALLESAHDLEDKVEKMDEQDKKFREGSDAGAKMHETLKSLQHSAHAYQVVTAELNQLLQDREIREKILDQLGEKAAAWGFGPIGTAEFNSATDFIDLAASIYQMGYSAQHAATLQSALDNMRAVQWQTSDRIAELQLEIQEECTAKQPLRTAIH